LRRNRTQGRKKKKEKGERRAGRGKASLHVASLGFLKRKGKENGGDRLGGKFAIHPKRKKKGKKRRRKRWKRRRSSKSSASRTNASSVEVENREKEKKKKKGKPHNPPLAKDHVPVVLRGKEKGEKARFYFPSFSKKGK